MKQVRSLFMKQVRAIFNSALCIGMAVILLLLLSGGMVGLVENRSLQLLESNSMKLLEEISFHMSSANRTGFSQCQLEYSDGAVRAIIYATEEPDPFDVAQVINRMNRVRASNEMVESIFLYNGKLDRYYSTEAVDFTRSKDTVAFLQAHSGEFSAYCELRTVYDDVTRQYDHQVMSYVVEERDRQTNQLECAVLVNISVQWLLSNMSQKGQENDYMLLLERDGTVLLNTAQEGCGSRWEPEGGVQAHIGDFFVDGEKVYGCVEVADSDWLLVHVQGYDLFREYAKSLRSQMLLLAIAALVLSIPMAILVARVIYRPVSKLLRHISEQSPDTLESQKRDVERLTHVFDTQKKRLEELERYRSSSEMQLQKGKIKDVLLDNGTYSVGSMAQLITGQEGELFIALLKIGGMQNLPKDSARERNTIRFAVVNVTEELLQPLGVVRAVTLSHGVIAVLVWPEQKRVTESSLQGRLANVSEKLYEMLEISVCGIVDRCPGTLEELSRCYRRLSEAMDYTLFYGSRCILLLEEVEPRMGSSAAYPSEQEQLLLGGLIGADSDKTAAALKAFLEQAEQGTPREYHRCVSRLVLTMQEQITQVNKNKLIKIQLDFEALRQQLEQAETSAQVRQLLEDAVESILLQTPYKPDQKNKTLVEGIKKLIDEEYMDKGMCGKMLASRMNISAGYLYALFKEEFGIGIQEYLNQVRLESAHALIVHTERPISQIIEECGMETSSFYRQYKARYGVSPREQRMQRKLGGS